VAQLFRKYIEAPVLTNISVNYSGFDAYDIEPLTVPDLFAERP
jgi:Ca-activated chloride channel family protein